MYYHIAKFCDVDLESNNCIIAYWFRAIDLSHCEPKLMSAAQKLMSSARLSWPESWSQPRVARADADVIQAEADIIQAEADII